MKFMMLVKGKNCDSGRPPNPELLAAIEKQSAEMIKGGVLLETGGLMPSAAGAKIQVAGKKIVVVDGPFTETKELVGGYAIMKLKSKQEAIEMGKAFMKLHVDILGESYEAELEIRQMMDFEAVVENCLGAGAA